MATEEYGPTQGEVIAQRIRDVRKLAAMSQTDFAKTIGVSRSFLSEVEAKKAKPSIEMIVGVATHFPNLASPYWLLLGYGAPGPYEGRATAGQQVEWKAVLCAQRLAAKLDLPTEPKDQAAEVEAKAVAMLVNAYAQAYAVALEAGGTESLARLEGEVRARDLANALSMNTDLILAIGPMVPF